MSGHQSNLSDPKYGYDMVVAVTQDAINLTMDNFLEQFTGKELIVCYRYDDKLEKSVRADYDDIKKVCNVDPFIVQPSDARLPKLDEYGFQFAFKAKIGIPIDIDPTKVPTIVTLDQGRDSVTYQLFFAEFTIVELQEKHKSIHWKNLSQRANKPWIFKFNVNIARRTDDKIFDTLPPAAQARLKNINPDTAFSVQALYLDLNNPRQQEMPSIENLDKDSDALAMLQRDFINTYWDELKKKGDVPLNYTVMPKNGSAHSPSLVPTAMNIEVSPYRDQAGQPMPDRRGLFTLDYLVMSQNRALPPSVQFGWNWIDDQESRQSHGVMAIRRERFVSFLNDVLSPSLNNVCFNPSVDVWQEGIETRYTWGLPATTTPLAYTAVADSTAHVLTFSHKGGPTRSNAGLNGALGWMAINADTTSDVYLEGNLIKVVTTVKSHAEATSLSSDTFNAEWVDITVSRWFQLSVDAEGDLVVSLSKDSPTTVDKSQPVDLTVWGWMVAVDADAWKRALSSTQNSVKSHLTDYAGKLTSMLNNTGAWVFPGGRTFLYKDVYLSQNLDLVTHITYADPG